MKSTSIIEGRFFEGLMFPATKESIIEHARSLGANETVLTMLSMIPSTSYDATADVLAAVKNNMPVELADPAIAMGETMDPELNEFDEEA